MTAKKSTTGPAATPKPRARKAPSKVQSITPEPIQPAASKPDAGKPLYAYIGAGDLAVARLRALSEPARLRAFAHAGDLSGVVKTLPAQLRGLQAKVTETANERYAELAARGEQVVTGLRAQGVTEQAEKAARSTVAHAKAAQASARKTVEAVAVAAFHAADKMK